MSSSRCVWGGGSSREASGVFSTEDRSVSLSLGMDSVSTVYISWYFMWKCKLHLSHCVILICDGWKHNWKTIFPICDPSALPWYILNMQHLDTPKHIRSSLPSPGFSVAGSSSPRPAGGSPLVASTWIIVSSLAGFTNTGDGLILLCSSSISLAFTLSCYFAFWIHW